MQQDKPQPHGATTSRRCFGGGGGQCHSPPIHVFLRTTRTTAREPSSSAIKQISARGTATSPVGPALAATSLQPNADAREARLGGALDAVRVVVEPHEVPHRAHYTGRGEWGAGPAWGRREVWRVGVDTDGRGGGTPWLYIPGGMGLQTGSI